MADVVRLVHVLSQEVIGRHERPLAIYRHFLEIEAIELNVLNVGIGLGAMLSVVRRLG